jgi:hypothetical protein
MSTRTLPSPAQLRDELKYSLPGIRLHGGYVQVTPQDREGRRCAAWEAEWYEIAAYYIEMGRPLDELEAALKAWPGVIRTTQVTGYPAQVRDADWPGFTRRRGTDDLRPQVLAHVGDPQTGEQEGKER